MENDTQKGILLLNWVAPRQQCTMLSSNSVLIARFMTGKGLFATKDHAWGRPSTRQIVIRSPKTSKTEIRAIVHLKGAVTISRRLSNEFGLKSHMPVWKSHLKPVMKILKKAGLCQTLTRLVSRWMEVVFWRMYHVVVCTSPHAY